MGGSLTVGTVRAGEAQPRATTRRESSRRLLTAVVAATTVVAGVLGTLAFGWDRPATAALEHKTGPSGVTLAGQTTWVQPGQAFDLRFHAPGTGLGLTMAVYPCLSDLSSFDRSLTAAGPPSNPIDRTTEAIPLTSLAGGSDPRTGDYQIDVPVTVGYPEAASGHFTIALTPGANECGAYPGGVYPVRVGVVNLASGSEVGGFTTHLVYTDIAATTQKLRLALVLPVTETWTANQKVGPGGLLAHPMEALAPPSSGEQAAANGTMAALLAHNAVPATVVTTGQTLDPPLALHGSLATSVASWSSTTGHDLANTTLVPTDASALLRSTVPGTLVSQVRMGATLTATALADHSHPPAVARGATTIWSSSQPLSPSAMTALSSLGYREFVLPQADITQASGVGSTQVPLSLAGSSGPVTVMPSNTDLDARLATNGNDPVLAAHQLLAELAQIYFEAPNSPEIRGLAVQALGDAPENPALVSTLLQGLTDAPVVQPVSLAGLFASLPEPVSCNHTCRLLAGRSSTTVNGAGVHRQIGDIAAFTLSAPGAHGVTHDLTEVTLASEAATLGASAQNGILANARAALDAQLGQLGISSGDKTVTLTSQHGRLPVTLVSSAPYAFNGTLSITNDKLLFANGTTNWQQPVSVGANHTTVVYVNVTNRTTDSYPVTVNLYAPHSGFLLGSAQITVHSSISSLVGIALTIGALAVLGWWWFRTARRRRRAARAEDGDDPDPVFDTPHHDGVTVP